MIPFTPRPYQAPIIRKLEESPRSLVLAGMGSGKTSAVLAAQEAIDPLGEHGPILIFAPLRVARTVWPPEVSKWDVSAHRKVSVVTGSVAQRKAALLTDADYYTINYECADWLLRYLGKTEWPFPTVVLDESTRVKAFRGHYRQTRNGGRSLTCTTGKHASAIARIAHEKTKRMVLLTGTPCPHSISDLWAQVWFLDAGERLGATYESFKARFLGPMGFRKDAAGVTHATEYGPVDGAYDEILRLIADLVVVIDPKDWFDIQEPIIRNVPIQLPPSVRRQYREMEKQFFIEIAHDRETKTYSAINAAAKSARLLQMSSGFLYDEWPKDAEGKPIKAGKRKWVDLHGEKIDALRSIVEEANGAPILCAYHWNPASVERLTKAFPRGRVLDADPRTVDLWNAGKIPILFAHPASAGHGLNLAAGGNITVHFDLTWNAGNYAQFNERNGPMRQFQAGLERPAWRYHIVAEDTLDEDVLDVVQGRIDFEAALKRRLKALQK